MAYSELAYRYAAALFEIAATPEMKDQCLQGLKALNKALIEDSVVAKYMTSPLVRSADKETALKNSLKGSGASAELTNFALLLAKKDRLSVLTEILAAFQACDDLARGITRGTVKTAKELSELQKKELSSAMEKITKKKVILQYSEDKNLIGGLSAQVGSLTFDDALSAHIRRIKEDLTRRIN
jgi:F-type H+-transporting ATPase subunit delta